MEQQKKAPLRIGILVLVVIVLLGIAFFFIRNTKDRSPSSQMDAAVKEQIKNCTFDAAFCNYMASSAVIFTKGYTMKSETVVNGKKTESIIRVDGKGNSYTTTLTDGKEEGSFIFLNNVSYMKSPEKKEWIEYPASNQQESSEKNTSVSETFSRELADLTKKSKDTLSVEKIGSEKCGALSCIIFQIKELSMNTSSKVWVDTKDYLARKMEMSAPGGGVTVMTFEYQPVTIEKPSPVVLMPTIGAPIDKTEVNMEELQKMMKDLPQTQESGEGE